MARRVRDRLALTFAFWSLVLIATTASLAWKFGWLPLEILRPATGAVAKGERKPARRKVLPDPAAPAQPPAAAVASALPEWAENEQTEPASREETAGPPPLGFRSPPRGRSTASPPPKNPLSEEPPEWAGDEPTSRPMASARTPSVPFDEAPDVPAPERRTPGVRRKSSGTDYSTTPIEHPTSGAQSSDEVTVIRPERPAVRFEKVARNPDDVGAAGERSEPEQYPATARTRTAARVSRDDGFSAPSPRRNVILRVGGEQPDVPAKGGASGPSDPRIQEIAKLLDSGERVAAHKEMSSLYWKNPELVPQLQATIDDNARIIYFSPQPHLMEPYVVEPGDQLSKIAKKYSVSWEYLAKLNQVDPRKIRAGQRLKVIKGPFAALVDLGHFELVVHCHGYYVKRYAIGIGKDDSTPIGKFTVKTKLVNPTYYGPNGNVIDKDDPANPLGERWIDLGDSYGIHGTIHPESIGKAESRGCIRLKNPDVEELYDLLTEGSEVIIRK